MSTHKAGGKASQHVSPAGKRLGVKAGSGKSVNSGAVIIRQRGSNFLTGEGTRKGRDHTIYSSKKGKVAIVEKMGRKVVKVI